MSYRKDVQKLGEGRVKSWFVLSIFGGLIGAVLLLYTSDRTFRQIAPWLLLFATLLFAFGNQVSIGLKGRLHSSQALMLLMLFPISIYGGYFGGGIGIMILAAFRLYGLTDIHAMNGIKTLLATSLNTVAALIFIFSHEVAWPPTLVMMAAGIAGGFMGPAMARRMKPVVIRAVVICVGVVMTAYFFHIAPK